MADALNIDNILDTCKNRVSRVGVELEGAWREVPPDARLEHDGSVFQNQRARLTDFTVGEIPIGPIEPAGVPTLMSIYYPHKVNATCGMHVHMSFETLWYYNLLMVPEYQETIIKYLTLWAESEKFKPEHHIFSRLRGESEYCQKAFWPDVQANTKRKTHDRGRPGHRYTVIHYCGRQNTIECRVLPMMQKVEQAIRAVQQVINITNACLYVLGKEDRGEVIEGKLELPGGAIYEEYIEESL